MIKVNRVAAALAAGTALLLVTWLAFPSRVSAQTPAQGQALGILLLLGLGSRPGAQPPADAKKPDGAVKKAAPADAKKPDGVAKKAAPTSGKPVRLTSDLVNGRMVVRSVEVTDGPRAKD